ncbi:MAG: hypothetical protein ACLRPN_03240 [Blautia massiliensis (ex Durand et al. 2017)]|uniref:hypothetical protein n=1 Tax=Blautia massiliensis (ex Durand et al. 2017) TaxID=1737424 RepID=UPI003990A3B9
MKRRVVAIFLSLTLCMGGTLEAGAAALGSTDVQMAAETAGNPAEDVFSDEAETTVQQPETEEDQTGSTDSTDSSEETPVAPENPAETPDVIETPEITETPETTEAPEATEAPDATTEDSTDPGDDFSAGDAQELDAPSADTAVQNKVENNKAEEISATGASLVNGVVVAKTSDWVSANGFYRLRKKKVAASAAPEGKASEDPAESSEEEQKTTVDETAAAAQEVQQTEELPEGAAESEQAQVLQNESAEGEQETAAEEVSTEEVSAAEASAETASADVVSAEETSEETAPAETETAVETSESVDNAETLAQDEGNASQVSETGSIEDNYFTAQDGLLKINTNGHVGYYLFNEDGYLVTGRMTREPGAAGYTGTQKTEWYFLENSKASLYSDSTGKAITPWTSNLGQQKRNYWLWTGTVFRYYNSQGDYKSIEAQNLVGKIKKIGNAYYTLMRNGKPRTGILKLTTGSTTYQYYFQPASKAGEIPGKLFYGGWTYVLNSKNQKRLSIVVRRLPHVDRS